MKSLSDYFPQASKSTLAANSSMELAKAYKNALARRTGRKKCGSMNATENDFAAILESMKRRGEILRYEYEGIILRWADMRYTPDFIVFSDPDFSASKLCPEETGFHRLNQCLTKPGNIKLIEIKGPHIWDRDIVRFKGARAYWPEFAFEMHQKTKQGWIRKF